MAVSMARIPLAELPEKLDITDNELLKEITDPKDVTCLNGPRVTYELLRRCVADDMVFQTVTM
jgi:poly(A) polymerase Pap1